MKTYHTFTTLPDPAVYQPRGFAHWMSCPSGGYVCVLDSGAEPEATWTSLPHLLDGSTGAGLKDFGCLPTHTMFQTARKLGVVSKFFKP